jgi:hypothetical protein
MYCKFSFVPNILEMKEYKFQMSKGKLSTTQQKGRNQNITENKDFCSCNYV